MRKRELSVVIVLLVSLTMIISVSLTGVANAAPKKKTTISIAAGRPGDAWYVLSHALSSFINERSDKLRAEVVATAGLTDATKMLLKKPGKRASHFNVTMIPGHSVWGKGEYLPLKIGSMLHSACTWVTLDPKLKTLADLKGKAVVLQRKKKYSYLWIFVDLLRQSGVWNDIKPMHGGIGAGITALRDGAAQAGSSTFNFIYPKTASLSSGLEELQTRGTLYFLQQGNIDKNMAMIEKACRAKEFEEMNLPTLGIVLPAKSLGPTQTEDMAVVSCPLFWAAGKEVSNDIVYEVTKMLYEAAKKAEFGNYHMMGKGITPDFLTTSFWTVEEARKNFHPGALKYYDDNGIKLKSFGDMY